MQETSRIGRRRRTPQGRIAAAVAPLVLLSVSTSAWTSAAFAQLVVSGSPDIHLDQSGTFLSPGDVSADIEALMPNRVDLGPLPDGAEITAYSTGFAEGEHFFVLDHTMTLPGSVTVRPRDVVQWDGAAYAIVLPGDANGIPDGVAIDAFTFDSSTGRFLLSFDTTVDLGSGFVVRDADVLDGSTGMLAFDAAAAGVPAGLDVDGVSHVATTQDLLLSFDVGGMIDGISFADEDVLRYSVNGIDPWTLEIDSSTTDPDWGAADLSALHAVPEPGALAMLSAGLAALAALARRGRVPARLLGGLAAISLPLAGPGLAHGSDGVVEINQACAASAIGCFAGDAGGFPVSITQSGSYRLTSSLDVRGQPSSGDVTAIAVTADAVTLDLGGFAILGPAQCTVGSCTSTGTGVGIDATWSSNRRDVAIRDGVIRGMGSHAIRCDRGCVVEAMRLESNGGSGVYVMNGGAVIRANIADNNGGPGLWATGVIRDNVAERNGDWGIWGNGPSSISGNRVASNQLGGIRCNRSPVVDNVISQNPTGVLITGSCGLRGNVITYTAHTSSVIDVSGGTLFELGPNVCGANISCP